MGRFYQTTAPEFVDDAMFKLPYEQMGAVLLAKDAKVGDDIETQTALGELLKAQGLKVDEPRVNEKIKQYEDKIQQNVDYIRGNVLNYDPTELSKLKREINEDWTRGEIAAIQGNKAAFDADMAMWREKQKKNPELYTDEYISALASNSLGGYKGVGYEGPSKYNTYSGLDATAMPEMNKWVDEALKDALPNFKSITRDTDTGRWLVTQGNSTKEMSEQDLNTILQTRLGGDVNLQAALKQRSEFGLEGFTGLFNEEGGLNPTIAFTEDGRIQFANNILGNSFRSGIEKFGFTETTQTHKMSETDRGKQDYAFALARKKEIEDNPHITVEGKDHIKTFNGSNLTEFAALRKAYDEEKQATLTKVEEIFMSANKIDRATLIKDFPETYKAIQAGNFSAVGNTPELKSLQKSLKIAQFEQSIRNATLKEIEDNVLGGTYNPKDPKHVAALSKALVTKGKQPVVTIAGWDIVDPEYRETPAGIKSLQTEAATVIPNMDLNIPKGALVVTVGGKTYDMSDPRYNSMNKAIAAGILKPEQIKTGEGLAGGSTTADGKTYGQTVVATFADGQKVSFDLSEKSFMPVKGASTKMEFQVNGRVNGKSFTSRLPDITTEKITAFNNDPKHKAAMTGEYIINRIGKNSVEIEGEVRDANGKLLKGAVIYHGEGGNKKRIAGAKNVKAGDEYKFSDGWIEVGFPDGTYEIHSTKEPEYRESLMEHFDYLYN